MAKLLQQQWRLSDTLQKEAEGAALEKSRERRRSSIGTLALPVCASQQKMSESLNIGADEVEFEAQSVRINYDGLFIQDENVSQVHPDNLTVLRELGRGACSVVMQAQHVQTRELYAIKVFNLFDRDKRAQLLKEVETLWSMECPSLINFVGGYLKDGSIHVVLEYMDRGSLTELIHDCSSLNIGEDLMAAITIQMLWGLGYLHFERRVHRDIKPQNVLLNSKGEVKLSDFGIARELEGEMDMAQTMVGTIRYMSPERLAGAGYGVAADVWSLGVVLLEMAARRLPFETIVSQIDLHDRLQQDLAVDDLVKLTPGHSIQFEEVLRGCLQPNPEDRLTPAELLELEWFRPFRRSALEFSGDKAECADDAGFLTSRSGGTEATEGLTSDESGGSRNEQRVGWKVQEVKVGSGSGGGCGGGGDDGGGGGEQSSDGGREEEGDAAEGAEESDGGGSDQHDLDKATYLVREYLIRADAHEISATEIAEAYSSTPNVALDAMLGASRATDGGDGDEQGGQMIRTMYSDFSGSESSISE